MEYTNIVQLGNKLYQEFKMTLEYKNYIGLYEWDALLTSFTEFIDALSDPLISSNLDNYKIQKVNPVERLGLTDSVIDLTEEGKSPKEIARFLSSQSLPVVEKDISSFLTEYGSADISTKIEKSNISVFDTQSQLQIMLDDMKEIKADIERMSEEELKTGKETRPNLKIKAHQEYRQTVNDAARLAEAIAHLQNMEEFKKVVIDEVRKLDPKTANQIYKRVKQAGLLFSSL